jgi:hypothetical protein
VFVRGFEHTLTNNNFETNLLSTFILQVGESTHMPKVDVGQILVIAGRLTRNFF